MTAHFLTVSSCIFVYYQNCAIVHIYNSLVQKKTNECCNLSFLSDVSAKKIHKQSKLDYVASTLLNSSGWVQFPRFDLCFGKMQRRC